MKVCKCCNNGKHQCPHCIFKFETKADLKMHLLNHGDKN